MDRFDILTEARDFFALSNVYYQIWYDVYQPFFNEIYLGVYNNEKDLLSNLKLKLPNCKSYSQIFPRPVSVFTGQILTHQKYAGGEVYKEFGDICFITYYSDGLDRFGYINAFQLKVDNQSGLNLRSSDKKQLDFYKQILLKQIFGNDLNNFNGATTEFLYYWIIKKNILNTFNEFPISSIDISGNHYSLLLPTSILLNTPNYHLGPFQRSILAITGIDISVIKNIAKPSLRELLDFIERINLEKIIKEKKFDDLKFINKNNNESLLPSIIFITEIKIATNGNQKSKTKEDDESISKKIAEKHIDISLKAKSIINQKYPDYDVYIATHDAKKIYPNIEKTRGEKFYDIKLYSSSTPRRENEVKQPDILVSDGNYAKYIIEVKWGAIDGSPWSDFRYFESDLEKMKKFNLESHWTCRINGKNDFIVNDKTRFILLSDFNKTITVLGKEKFEEIFSRLKSKFKNLNINFELADIQKHVDDIPSFLKII